MISLSRQIRLLSWFLLFTGIDARAYLEVFLSIPLDTNPGWSTTGSWAYGLPLGAPSDPASGHTGTAVYGTNLAGAYPHNIPANDPHLLTSTAFDCTGRQNVNVGFWRYACIEASPNDNAAVEVSLDGVNWTSVWSHSSLICQGTWSYFQYPLGALADNQPQVFVRWRLGSTNASTTYGGWNIDDIELLAENGLPGLTVQATDASAAEAGASTGTFAITRTGPTSNPLVVSYSLTGQAVAADYQPLSGTVTFAADAAGATVVVTPVDDTVVEGPETAVLTLSPQAGYGVGAANEATVTITDNDQPFVTIMADDAGAAENPADPGSFRITRTAPLSAAITVNITVGGTATAGDDYSALPATVSFPAGVTTARLTVQPLNDSEIEGQQTVIATLAPNGVSYAITSPSAGTVTIADDDVPTVTVSVIDDSGNETGLDPMEFEFTRTPPLTQALTVLYGVSFADSTTSSGDYTGLLSSISIPAGAASATRTVTPVNDSNVESTEVLTIQISPSVLAYNIGTAMKASARILDDEPTQLSLSTPDATMNEALGNTALVQVSRKGLASSALSFGLAYSGTASPGEYTPSSTVFNMNAGVNEHYLVFTGNSDGIQEGTETVEINLVASPGYAFGTNTGVALFLADDDPQRFGVLNTDFVLADTSTVYAGDQAILSNPGGTTWNKVHNKYTYFMPLKDQFGVDTKVELYASSSAVSTSSGTPPFGDGFGGLGSGTNLIFLNLDPTRLYDVVIYCEGDSGRVTAYDANGSYMKTRSSGVETLPGVEGADYLRFHRLRPYVFSGLGHVGLLVGINPSSSFNTCITVAAQIRESAPSPFLGVDHAGGWAQVRFYNTEIGKTYTVERSTDMLYWSPVHTFGGNGGFLDYTDPSPPGPRVYYRTSQP